MKIELHENFQSTIKDKHLLLDTNIFIFAFQNPSEFGSFFNLLKTPEYNVTITTTKQVLYEFLKGSTTEIKFKEKRDFIENIIEIYLPQTPDLDSNIELLIKKYKIEGKDLSITDLTLGSLLIKYRANICLLSADQGDFPTNIYKIESFISLLEVNRIRGIGLYSY